MVAKQYTSMKSIMSSTSRVSFGIEDAQYVVSILKQFAAQGLDLSFHSTMAGSVKERFNEGFFILRSETLDADFVFVRINAGRGLFGGQKSRISSFVGLVADDRLMPSATFNNLVTGLASIRAIYRGQGLI